MKLKVVLEHNNMDYMIIPDVEVDVDLGEDYIHVFFRGPKDSEEVSIRCYEELSKFIKGRGIKKILIEEDFPNQVSASEMYNVINTIPKLFPKNIRIAHVDRRHSDMDLNFFGEDIAIQLGIDGQAFHSVKEAKEWLEIPGKS